MERTCCACGTKTTGETTETGIRFVRFPVQRKDLRQKWIEAMGRGNFKPSPDSFVCSKHFDSTCFERWKNAIRLKADAVPTLFNIGPPKTDLAANADDSKNNENNMELSFVKSTTLKTFSKRPKPATQKEIAIRNENVYEEARASSGAITGSKRSHSEVSCDENFHGYVNVEELSGSSDDVSLPRLRMVHTNNSDYEDDVEDPSDLDVPLIQGVDYETLDFTDMPEVDLTHVENIGSVGDFFDTENLSLFSHPSMESECLDTSLTTSVVRPPRAERDEVDGQTILSFVSFEDLESFSQNQPTCSTLRLTKTHDYRLIKGWRNKFHGVDEKIEEKRVSEESDHPTSPLEFHLRSGETISPVHAEYAVSALRSPDESHDTSKEGVEKMDEEPSVVECPVTQTSGNGEKNKPKQKSTRRLSARDKCPPPKRRLIGDYRSSSPPPPQCGSLIDPLTSDEIPVKEDCYKENYDVPGHWGANQLSNSVCGKLFCRLGCVCDSLAVNREASEHCNLAECMFQCVCGYQKDKAPRRNTTFYKLLKGNESYYSKIDWSSQRQRRERKIPERFRDSIFHHDTDTLVSRVLSEEKSRLNARRNQAAHANRTVAAPQSSPQRNNTKQISPSLPNRRAAGGSGPATRSNPPAPPKPAPLSAPQKPKRQPFRVKIFSDEMKLLRWGSYVSMRKAVVPPYKKIFCMDHAIYSCPCLAANRRYIRIAKRFTPPQVSYNHRPRKSSENPVPVGVKKEPYVPETSSSHYKVAPVPSSPNVTAVAQVSDASSLKGIAPLHDGQSPSGLPKATSAATSTAAKKTPIELPAKNTEVKRGSNSALTKMARLVQGERFRQLILQEKMRIFDEDIDLTIRSGESVELIAWIRFHRIYHAGRMHIRILIRRTGPMILVMRPNEIVAEDVTTDIKDMKNDPNAPEIVQELLDPCISVGETTRYALLLCDGVKWELVGCLAPSSTPVPDPKMFSPDVPEENESDKSDVRPPPPLPCSPPLISPPDPIVLSPASPLPLGPHERKIRPGPRSRTVIRVVPVTPTESAKKDAIPVKLSNDVSNSIPGAMKSTYRSDNTERNSPSPADATSEPNVSQKAVEARRVMSVGKVSFNSLGSLTKKIVTTGVTPASRDTTHLTLVPNRSVPGLIRIKDEPGLQSKPSTSNASQVVPRLLAVSHAGNLVPKSTSQTKPNPSPTTSAPVALTADQRRRLLSKLCQSQVAVLNKANSKIIGISESLLSPEKKNGEMMVVKLNAAASEQLSTMNSSRSAAPQQVKAGGAAPTPPSTTRPLQFPNNNNSASLTLASFAASVSSTSASGAGRVRNTTKLPQTSAVSSVLKMPQATQQASKQIANLRIASGGVGKPLKIIIAHPRPSVPNSPSPSLNSSLPANDAHDPTLLPLTPMPSADISLSLPGSNDDIALSLDESPISQTADPTLLPQSVASEAEITFPALASVNVSCVRLPTGSWSRRLKIIYNLSDLPSTQKSSALPTQTTVLLPLQNEDDQWCIVAIEHVPSSGLEIPGSNISIPQSILEQAAQTACARNFRVSFPLHVIGGHHNPVPQKGFGVFGIPNLPCHVFLGPFPHDYLSNLNCTIPYMVQIPCGSSSTDPSASSATDEDVKPVTGPNVEANCSSSLAIDANNTSGQVESDTQDDDESSLDSSEECSFVPEDRKPVSDIIYGCQANYRGLDRYRISGILASKEPFGDGTKRSNSDDDDLEIIKDVHLATREGRLPKMRYLSVDQLPAKPERVFVARVANLPPTTVSILDDGLVVVKHPLNPEQSLKFASIDDGKNWLRSLSIVTRSIQISNNNQTPSDPEIPIPEQATVEPAVNIRSKPCPKSRKLTTQSNTVASSMVLRRSSPVGSDVESSNSNSTSSPTGPRTHRTDQQHIIHNQRERERREILAHHIRELGMLLTDTEGEIPMTKLSVLQHATAAIKSLETASKEMKSQYGRLISQRRTLINKRKSIYSSLPSDVKSVFQCLTENTPLPERHKEMTLKTEKLDDDAEILVDDVVELDNPKMENVEDVPHIDIEVETDICGDFNDFLEVDVVSVDSDDLSQAKNDDCEWSCFPVRKN